MSRDLKSEFRCPKCKKKQGRGVYACAHYDVDLVGPCQYCGVRLLLPANFGRVVVYEQVKLERKRA